ncbi:nucleotide exchange factor GrpE [Patescibacteria group bacterium]|nr:nucleotide exchange factor GrpE [Patescibacteria group bacterium]
MDDDEVVIEHDSEESTGESEEDIAALEDRADTKVTKLRKELEVVKKEKLENLDGWQRAKADYVNALKRFEEEKKAAILLGTIVAAKAFLPAIDSLERAQMSGVLPEGFEGIVKQLEGAAQSLGLTQFGAIDEQFDPLLHEALGQDNAESKENDDHITAVLETGWKIGDMVLRPAKVRVSHFDEG